MCTELSGPRQQTNKLLLHNFNNQHDFKIHFILRFSFRLKIEVFLLKEFMHQPRPPQLNLHKVWGWGGEPPWSDGLGLKGGKEKLFPKEYLDLFDLLQIFKITQIFKSDETPTWKQTVSETNPVIVDGDEVKGGCPVDVDLEEGGSPS